jgi:Ca2+-transporting ATPase
MAANQADLAKFGIRPEPEVPLPLASSDSGLSVAQAAQRLAEDGPNALTGGQRRSLMSIALETDRARADVSVAARR